MREIQGYFEGVSILSDKTAPCHDWHGAVLFCDMTAVSYTHLAGYTDGTVRPNAKNTRAEVAMIFYRLLDEDVRAANESSTNTFSDVTENMWCNTAVSTIARLKIVKGRSAENFDPNAPITRAEFATICARFDHSSVEGTESFSDIHGHWAEKLSVPSTRCV